MTHPETALADTQLTQAIDSLRRALAVLAGEITADNATPEHHLDVARECCEVSYRLGVRESRLAAALDAPSAFPADPLARRCSDDGPFPWEDSPLTGGDTPSERRQNDER